MKKWLPKLSTGTLIAQLITGYAAYYLLLTDNRFHCSIAYIIHYAHTLALRQHLTLLGLLPIYIAIVIFGAAMLGVAFSHHLDSYIKRILKQKRSKAPFTSQI
jgi:hypothetical protein